MMKIIKHAEIKELAKNQGENRQYRQTPRYPDIVIIKHGHQRDCDNIFKKLNNKMENFSGELETIKEINEDSATKK